VRSAAIILVAILASTTLADERPGMRQMSRAGGLLSPPSQRDLVDARAMLKERFREPLSHADTSTGALQAAAILLDAAASEDDPALRWLMLDEARELGISTGQAVIVNRAVTSASAFYDFDALATELRSLGDIPLRALDPARATRLAEAAETMASRADTDSRPDVAAAARRLAVNAWQRSGNLDAARRVLQMWDKLQPVMP
jgi:hypothetical protein